MLTRRELVRRGAVGGAGLLLGPTMLDRAALGAQSVASSLDKFVWPLPTPGGGIVVASPRRAGAYAFTQRLIERRLHPQLPPTPIFAYDDGSGLGGQAGSFGMALVARRGSPLDITYTNGLSTYPSWVPVDTRLIPPDQVAPHVPVRCMTHRHGGFVAAVSDGNPAITPDGFGPGSTNGSTQRVHYPNEQPATLMWFHDHGLGTTRLNVFAGLAAAYVLRGDGDDGTPDNPIGIPGGRYEIPLVIQDRQFNPDGTFLYPTQQSSLGITWLGEYFRRYGGPSGFGSKVVGTPA